MGAKNQKTERTTKMVKNQTVKNQKVKNQKAKKAKSQKHQLQSAKTANGKNVKNLPVLWAVLLNVLLTFANCHVMMVPMLLMDHPRPNVSRTPIRPSPGARTSETVVW